MSTNNMYRVGDFVYFEALVGAPYQIRKIEELNKTPQGAVEAKVLCFFRRRDISKNLVQQAEKHRFLEDDEYFNEDSNTSSPKLQNPKYPDNNECGYFKDSHLLTPIQSHQAKHRELFCSRQQDILPATHIRGKCNVTLYNDEEPIFDYINKEDTFFYKFTYDSSAKTLNSDRNAIRVGPGYQKQVKDVIRDSNSRSERDELIFIPDENNTDIEKFIFITRSLGTLGRACDSHTLAKNPDLLYAATSASRDFSVQRAHDYWFKSNGNMDKALDLILPNGNPRIFKDELEQWSIKEFTIFLQGLEEYKKNFYLIQSKLLPWKTLKSIIEFYYMYKSTDKYWASKRLKNSTIVDLKLKQVYIPSFTKPNASVLCTKPIDANSCCESCFSTKSVQWYNWGNSSRLCSNCWVYWKRYGGLKNPNSKECSSDISQESNIANGDSGENPNQLGSFKCNQPNCDKDFRVRAQLVRHLQQSHGITQSNISNGSYDILNHYSKPGSNMSNPNHIISMPSGRGMVKPRSTSVHQVDLRYRVGRLVFSNLIKPKKIARNHNRNNADLDIIYRKIENIPVENLNKDSLANLFNFETKYKSADEVVGALWLSKNIEISKCKTVTDLYNPCSTNGNHESTINNKRQFNGTSEEPPTKVAKKLNNCNEVNISNLSTN